MIDIHVSISLLLHWRISKNCWHSGATKDISCLPWDSSLNHSWPRWNYFHGQMKKSRNINKQLLKIQASFISCLLSGNSLEGLSSFINHKYMQITHFLVKRLTHPNSQVSFFFSLLYLFSNCIPIFSSHFDTSTYLQIESTIAKKYYNGPFYVYEFW